MERTGRFQVPDTIGLGVAVRPKDSVVIAADYVRVTNLRVTPALRGGFWFDPDHTVRDLSTGAGDQLDTRFRAILPGGEDLWHYTFGGGLALSRVFEVNAGADISKRSSYASASVIVRLF